MISADSFYVISEAFGFESHLFYIVHKGFASGCVSTLSNPINTFYHFFACSHPFLSN